MCNLSLLYWCGLVTVQGSHGSIGFVILWLKYQVHFETIITHLGEKNY